MTQKLKIEQYLNEKLQDEYYELYELVIEEIIDNLDEMTDARCQEYLKEIIYIGACGGNVNSLIYYNDTNSIFDLHAEEIIQYFDEVSEETGDKNVMEFFSSLNIGFGDWNQIRYGIVCALFEDICMRIIQEVFEE